jgi:FkbM family methyltransferase
MTSIVSLHGDSSIEVDTIDNIMDQEIVTFLKMNIEGSELAVLRGAKKQ